MNNKKLIFFFIANFVLSLLIFLILFLLFQNSFNNKNIGDSLNTSNKNKEVVVNQKEVIKTQITDLENQVIKTVNESGPAVVNIIITKNLKIFIENPFDYYGGKIIEKKEKIGGGSGIGIRADGYIITNKHVVADLNADYSVVTKDGDVYKVSKIWFDPIFDLAILKVVDKNGNPPINFKTAKIRSIKEEVKIGQFVVAIGNALGEYENSATFGIISAKGRVLDDLPPVVRSLYIGLYQTDAAINPGNSGGPLINIAGKVIGVNTAISAIGQGIGFAMPISQELVKATLKSIEKYGKIKRPFLGVLYTTLNKSIAKSKGLNYFQGAYIEKVLPNTPAESVGLEKGDVILKIDDIKITSDNVLPFVLFTYLPGDTVELLVYKTKLDTLKKIKVKLGEFKF